MQDLFKDALGSITYPPGEANLTPGALYVIATPIGNLGDITLRAINTFKKVDAIICEDSRVTGKLLQALNIKKSLLLYNDQSSQSTRSQILGRLQQKQTLALVSDAGTPLISDPGYKLISWLLENEIKIYALPGPCSAIAALSIAGIPSDRFYFAGFVPALATQKDKFLKELVTINTTLIFFETAGRLISTLEVMQTIFGNRKAAIAREISKLHEETKKASLSALQDYYQAHPPRGEIVILLAPEDEQNQQVNWDLIEQELISGLKKTKPKELVALVSEQHKVNKKLVYQKMLQILKNEKNL